MIKKPIGYISYTHGLDGKVKIVPMVEKNAFENYLQNKVIFLDNEDHQRLNITIVAFNGKIFLCKIDNINNIEEAKKLTKHEIYIDAKNDEYINPESLVGFDVYLHNSQNIKYGSVVDFGNYGAGDLIEIKTTHNKMEYYQCNTANIVKINTKNKSIILQKREEY